MPLADGKVLVIAFGQFVDRCQVVELRECLETVNHLVHPVICWEQLANKLGEDLD